MEIKQLHSIKEINSLNINGSGIIPFSYYDNEIYFLFGRESKDIRWAEKGLWGDFGGTIDIKEENNFDGMIREFYEETNGIFGEKEDIKKYLIENIEKLLFIKSDIYNGVILFLPVKYDKNLPIYFKKNYLFCKKILKEKKNIENVRKEGYLEKDMIAWFTIQDIKKNTKKFRKCNKEIINSIEIFFNY